VPDIELTYLGTATLVLRLGDTRFLTDPVFDPCGSSYDFGPWFTPRSWFASEKRYVTPASPDALGRFDAVLLSHDHHADNLDRAGRAFVADERNVEQVLTTPPGARRLARPLVDGGLGLGRRVAGLAPGSRARVGNVTITTTVARHGPIYAPQVDEVTGFLLDVDDGPRVWVSGDTVLYPALREELDRIRRERSVDLAIVHCGSVGFPRALGFGAARFTFDGAEATEACRLLDPKSVLPVHRSGWTHFCESEAELMRVFRRGRFAERTRWLELGETLAL